MKNILAYLTPRGSTLPSGDSSRLYQISGSERYVVKYESGSDTYATWTIPIVPDQYTSNPSIALAWRGLSDSTYCTWAVSCEVIVPETSTQDLGTDNYDSDNSTQATATNSYLQETTIDLTANDSLVSNSFLRIKVKRIGTATTPNEDVGDVELLGATLYCAVAPTIDFVTTLPSSPVDGQMCILSNNGYPDNYGLGMFRYNTGVNQWQQVGSPIALDGSGGVNGMFTTDPNGNFVWETKQANSPTAYQIMYSNGYMQWWVVGGPALQLSSGGFSYTNGTFQVDSVGNLIANTVNVQGTGSNLPLVFNEVPSGTINGVNGTFTTAQNPVSSKLMLAKNGLVQTLGVDFTLSGNTISFVSGNYPQTGDNLVCTYQF